MKNEKRNFTNRPRRPRSAPELARRSEDATPRDHFFRWLTFIIALHAIGLTLFFLSTRQSGDSAASPSSNSAFVNPPEREADARSQQQFFELVRNAPEHLPVLPANRNPNKTASDIVLPDDEQVAELRRLEREQSDRELTTRKKLEEIRNERVRMEKEAEAIAKAERERVARLERERIRRDEEALKKELAAAAAAEKEKAREEARKIAKAKAKAEEAAEAKAKAVADEKSRAAVAEADAARAAKAKADAAAKAKAVADAKAKAEADAAAKKLADARSAENARKSDSTGTSGNKQTTGSSGTANNAGSGTVKRGIPVADMNWYNNAVLAPTFTNAWAQPSGPDYDGRNYSVAVRIVVRKDGRVLSKEVVRSSGNATVDNSIRAALGRVSQLAPLPREYRNETYTETLTFALDS